MPNSDSPVGILRTEPERINPAIILADILMRRDAQELLTLEEVAEAERVLAIGNDEIDVIEFHRKAFLKTPASPIDYIPLGF